MQAVGFGYIQLEENVCQLYSMDVLHHTMKLFGLFKTRLEKNYLRVYANIGRAEYSERDKRKLSEHFISLAKELYDSPILKYDITGPGYGISKGSPLLGQRAFDNRIKSKGYSKLDGLTIRAEAHAYSSMFLLLNNAHDPDRLEAYFSWPHAQDKALGQAVKIIRSLSKVMQIEYAYAYPTDNSLNDIGEWKNKKGIFSISLSMPESERIWDRHIREIKTGTIKKVYPINCFNWVQVSQVNGIEPHDKISLENGNEIWRFEAGALKGLNMSAICTVLK